MKGVLVIADGLGGRPTDWGGQTCLQAARTPHLDALARRGAVGLLDPIGPGIRPGSDTAHLAIFGYDPERDYPGRGVFEAAGVGLDVGAGDICFRTNFATVDEALIVVDRRAGRIESGQEELEQALQGLTLETAPDVQVRFRASTEHRGALVLRGEGLSPHITEADPHQTGIEVRAVVPTDGTSNAERTARIVNEMIRRSYELLNDLPVNRARREEGKPPANVVLPRGASTIPHFPTLPERYGIEGSVIAAGALYIGIGVLIGLAFKPVEGATGGVDSKVVKKAERALQELGTKDFVFAHMKGTDSAGHDHNAEAKVAFLEKIDEAMGVLMGNMDWGETHLAFTGDHCTPVVYGDHTGEPVPVVIAGPNVLPDRVGTFSEASAMEGGLGRFSRNVVPVLASYNNWLRKVGT